MGSITSNMSIYIPAAGETNYDNSFAVGMINIDQHDHSGPPNNGVPLSSSGLADGSVTYAKLNANASDTTTGIGPSGSAGANQLAILGLLKNIYVLATTSGFISKDGSAAHARTFTGTANQVSISNGDGVSGNPVLSLPSTIYTNISFDSGVTILNTYKKGTFTPSIAFGGASSGVMYNGQLGVYWQIGSVIYYHINLTLSNKGTSTGAVTIEGLPTASAMDNSNNVPSIQCNISSYPSSTSYISGEQNVGATNIEINACGPGQSTNVTNANIGNSSSFQISGFYWVA